MFQNKDTDADYIHNILQLKWNTYFKNEGMWPLCQSPVDLDTSVACVHRIHTDNI